MQMIFISSKLDAQLSEQSEISLITCRPGDEVYSSFGHTAIRIYDPQIKLDILYNYGMFSFSEPNFLIKFLRGKLEYWVGIEKYKAFVDLYSSEKRSVIQQKLNLPLEQKNKLFNALRNNLKPENRKYMYDFFFDNCSTRPRDILINNIEGIQFDSTITDNPSFRDLIDEYMVAQPWTDFGIDLIIGSIADKEAGVMDQMFLPEYLMMHFDNSSIVDSNTLIVDYEKEAESRKSVPLFSPVLIFSFVLLLELVFFLRRDKIDEKRLAIYDKVWYWVLGISGILILFMWFGTDHIATKNNLNILWLNPLYFFLIFKPKKTITIKLLLGLLLLGILQFNFIQEFHIASILIILTVFLKLLRNNQQNLSLHK